MSNLRLFFKAIEWKTSIHHLMGLCALLDQWSNKRLNTSSCLARRHLKPLEIFGSEIIFFFVRFGLFKFVSIASVIILG